MTNYFVKIDDIFVMLKMIEFSVFTNKGSKNNDK